MNKTDFITEVARKANVTKAEAERVMSAFEDVVVSATRCRARRTCWQSMFTRR